MKRIERERQFEKSGAKEPGPVNPWPFPPKKTSTMKKLILLTLCAGTLVYSSCKERYREAARTEGRPEGIWRDAKYGERNSDAFRQQSERLASMMAADLHLSPQVRNQVQRAYYQRAIRLQEVREKDNTYVSNRRAKLNNHVGVSNNALTNPATGAPIGTSNPLLEEEMAAIDRETEGTIQELLTDEQFARYQADQNRYTLHLQQL
jgi:hypothetical protein